MKLGLRGMPEGASIVFCGEYYYHEGPHDAFLLVFQFHIQK